LPNHSCADHVIFRVFLSEVIFDEKVLGIIREALMNPHIGRVFHRDVITKPLVRGFMNNDEVELKTNATETRITLQVAIAKPISVGD